LPWKLPPWFTHEGVASRRWADKNESNGKTRGLAKPITTTVADLPDPINSRWCAEELNANGCDLQDLAASAPALLTARELCLITPRYRTLRFTQTLVCPAVESSTGSWFAHPLLFPSRGQITSGSNHPCWSARRALRAASATKNAADRLGALDRPEMQRLRQIPPQSVRIRVGPGPQDLQARSPRSAKAPARAMDNEKDLQLSRSPKPLPIN
jgi:hypothetical protein